MLTLPSPCPHSRHLGDSSAQEGDPVHTQLIIRSVLEHEQFLIGVAMLDRVRSEGECSHGARFGPW